MDDREKTTGVSLGEKLHAELQDAAKRIDRNVSYILRQAARDWLDKQPEQPKKQRKARAG